MRVKWNIKKNLMEAGGPEHKKQKKNGERVTRCVFTLNNWTSAEWQSLVLPTGELRKKTTWGIIGKETGENGTPHLQGNCVYERFQRCNCNRCLQ